MNKMADFYDIEVSLMRDCVPAQKETQKQIQRFDYLSRKNVFRFIWMGEPLDACYLSYLFNIYPVLQILYSCISEWRQIFRLGYQSLLYSFLDKYQNIDIKQIADFIKGLIKDQEAVENAVSSPLSNGFFEGTNSKLKMVKRTMYGRCSCQLLAAKLMLNLSR